jgi:UDP-glucose 4-epimerase
MSVMISGGTGFVGLNVVEALLSRGERVVCYAVDSPPDAAVRALAKLPGELIVERGDVRDADAFASALRRHAVDRLFPFAAITSGPERERDAPERVLEVNLLGFVAQLRAARDAGVRRVIAPSSSSVYGDRAYGAGPMDEVATPCIPASVYGVSKYALERTALRLGALWEMDVIAARIGPVFGPWERDTGLRDTLSVYWHLARAATGGENAVLPPVIPANPWVYSRDVASALVHLLDVVNPEARVFNISTGIATSEGVLDWARRLRGAYPGWTWRQSADPAEVTIALGDMRDRAAMSVARIGATGWTPRYSPELAFADYIAWIGANPGGFG